MKATTGIGTAAGFLVVLGLALLLLIGLACFNTNPYRAGEGKNPSIRTIPHDVVFNGVGHAEGMCDPATNCSACHGTDLSGGPNGAPSCTKCHGVFWGPDCGKNLHTVNLGGHYHQPNYCQPQGDCSACHGADLKGGSGGQPSCYACHGAVWTLSDCGQNHHSVNKDGVMHGANYCHPSGDCTLCHGVDLRGGSNGEPSCYSCHGAFWTSGDCGNLDHTVKLGDVYHMSNYCRPYQNCTECHGSTLHGGPNGEPSCLKCHDQKKWMNCGSTQHNQPRDGVEHASGYCQPFVNCIFCHGDQLQGGPNHEPGCTQCHGPKWNESDCGGGIR